MDERDQELIKNIRSIKMRLGIGVIRTLNGTDHDLMNQLDRMEEIVNKSSKENHPNNQVSDPRDNPFIGEDDSWIHDVDMGCR